MRLYYNCIILWTYRNEYPLCHLYRKSTHYLIFSTHLKNINHACTLILCKTVKGASMQLEEKC